MATATRARRRRSTVARSRSWRPTARSRLSIRTRPVPQPSSDTVSMMLKMAMATSTMPASAVPSTRLSTTSSTKLDGAVDDASPPGSGRRRARPRRPPRRRAGWRGRPDRSPERPARSLRGLQGGGDRGVELGLLGGPGPGEALELGAARDQHGEVRVGEPGGGGTGGRGGRGGSVPARARSAAGEPSAAAAAAKRCASARAASSAAAIPALDHVGLLVGAVHLVEAHRRAGLGVLPVPGHEAAVAAGQVPRDPVAVPAGPGLRAAAHPIECRVWIRSRSPSANAVVGAASARRPVHQGASATEPWATGPSSIADRPGGRAPGGQAAHVERAAARPPRCGTPSHVVAASSSGTTSRGSGAADQASRVAASVVTSWAATGPSADLHERGGGAVGAEHLERGLPHLVDAAEADRHGQARLLVGVGQQLGEVGEQRAGAGVGDELAARTTARPARALSARPTAPRVIRVLASRRPR